jgi:hypothetical protein
MSFIGWRHECEGYDGDETAVYNGETCSRCGLSEGAWRLPKTTDDQLRAECERRGGFGYVDPFRGIVERESDRMRSDYEGACKLVAEMHAAATGGKVGDGPRLGVLEDVVALRTERDEWKRRAEAAEAAQAFVLARREPRPLAVWTNEPGPGFATLPRPCVDSEYWPDPVDLLADDA